jgi:hypothetical protein
VALRFGANHCRHLQVIKAYPEAMTTGSFESLVHVHQKERHKTKGVRKTGKLFLFLFSTRCSMLLEQLGYYAAYSDNSLPTFRDNLSIPFPRNYFQEVIFVLGFLGGRG